MTKNLLTYICYSLLLLFTLCSVTAKGGRLFNNSLNKNLSNSTVTPPPFEQIAINLYYRNANNSVSLVDGVLAQFDPTFSNAIDGLDALKFTNIGENLALLRNTVSLTIERRQIIGVTDTLYFSLKNTTIRDYQFQFSPANGLDHPCLSAFLEDSYLLTSTPVDLNGTTTINFSVTAAPASSLVTRFKLVFKTGIVWTGALSADWFDTNNWLGGVIPSATCGDALIPNTPLKPIINSGVAMVKNLNIQPGATLTVNNSTLKVSAAITNVGPVITKNGTVELNGTLAQVLAANTFSGDSINGFIINNSSGVTISGPLKILDSLSVQKGSFKLNGNVVTLKSSAAKTASVAALNAGSINYGVGGRFIIERYIPAHRAWRLITAPVVAATIQTINQAWQDSVINTSLTYASNKNPHPGFGTHISGNSTALGFDSTPRNNPSLKIYNAVSGTWSGIANTKVLPVTYKPGYMLFVRGDRSVNLNQGVYAPPTNTVLRTEGQIKTGTQVVNVTGAGFTLIGNPFPARVDFKTITKGANCPDAYYLWDPLLTGMNGVGGFVTLSRSGAGYVASPNPISPISLTGRIESGAAFFVDFAGPGNLSIKEADKTFGSAVVFRPPSQTLRTNLYAVNNDSSVSLSDGVLTMYSKDFNNLVDVDDCRKITNFSENLALNRNSKYLSIERRKTISGYDTVFLRISQMAKKNYQLEFISDSLARPGLEASLEDDYLKTKTQIKLDGNTIVNFNVTSDTSSKAADRFRVLFKVNATLAVTFSKVKAYRQNDNTNVEWTVENELNIQQYEVQRSADGVHFSSLATVIASRNDYSTASYQWADAGSVAGTLYYRIRSISMNGDTHYSDAIKITVDKGKSEIVVFPNPIVDRTVNVQLFNQPKGKYTIRLINKLGQVFITKQVQHDDGSTTEILRLNKAMSHGTYQLQVTKPDNNKVVIEIVQ